MVKFSIKNSVASLSKSLNIMAKEFISRTDKIAIGFDRFEICNILQSNYFAEVVKISKIIAK